MTRFHDTWFDVMFDEAIEQLEKKVRNKTMRKRLQDWAIHKYGFEHWVTIWVFKLTSPK